MGSKGQRLYPEKEKVASALSLLQHPAKSSLHRTVVLLRTQ